MEQIYSAVEPAATPRKSTTAHARSVSSANCAESCILSGMAGVHSRARRRRSRLGAKCYTSSMAVFRGSVRVFPELESVVDDEGVGDLVTLLDCRPLTAEAFLSPIAFANQIAIRGRAALEPWFDHNGAFALITRDNIVVVVARTNAADLRGLCRAITNEPRRALIIVVADSYGGDLKDLPESMDAPVVVVVRES